MQIAEYQPRPAVDDVWHDEKHNNLKIKEIVSLAEGREGSVYTSIRFSPVDGTLRGLREDIFVKRYHAPTSVYLRAARHGDAEARKVLYGILYGAILGDDWTLAFASYDKIDVLLQRIIDRWIATGSLKEAVSKPFEYTTGERLLPGQMAMLDKKGWIVKFVPNANPVIGVATHTLEAGETVTMGRGIAFDITTAAYSVALVPNPQADLYALAAQLVAKDAVSGDARPIGKAPELAMGYGKPDAPSILEWPGIIGPYGKKHDVATAVIRFYKEGPKLHSVKNARITWPALDELRSVGMNLDISRTGTIVTDIDNLGDFIESLRKSGEEDRRRSIEKRADKFAEDVGTQHARKRDNRHDRRAAKVREHMQKTAYDFSDGERGAAMGKPTEEQVMMALLTLVTYSHGNAKASGWWDRHYKEGVPLVNKPGERATGRQRPFSELMALAHTELSEAVEYDRKGGNDDKLPEMDGRTVELMDELHRVLDALGATGADLSAYWAKGEFNLSRVDHKIENRTAKGGKSY